MEEENCHFVYKHLWSPMKAPCSPGWVSPRRGEGPGTQSIQRRDFPAQGGLEQCCLWKVSSEYQQATQWSCVPAAGDNHLLPTREMTPTFVVSNCFKVNTAHLCDTADVLSQNCIKSPVNVDKSESCWENMGVCVSSVAVRKECQPHHYLKGVSLSESLWC